MIQKIRTHQLLIVLCIVLITASIFGRNVFHPDIDERIAALTKQIEQSPDEPSLYFKRGQLHLQHEDYDIAMADFEHVRQLDPDMEGLQLARAATYLNGGWPKSALIILDAMIRDDPEDAIVLLLRGRTHAALDAHLLAASDIEQAIVHLHNPTPDQYIELASEFIEAGDAHINEALGAIEHGIKRFGPLVTLQLFAIDLELKLEHVDKALHRLRTIANQSPRKERFLIRRGEILEEAQRYEEAQDAYEAGLDAIEQLPPRFKTTRVVVAIKNQAIQAILRLGAQPQSASDPEDEVIDP